MGVMSAKEAREISSLNSDYKVNEVLNEIQVMINDSIHRGHFCISFLTQSSRLYGSALDSVVSKLRSLGYSVVTPPQQDSVCRINISWEDL